MFFALRFDFRNPAFADTAMAERYCAALDMAEWADRLGCGFIAISEHHGSPDGYLPSPIPMLAAMAARTSTVRFMLAALIAPFHDPLRLAEDLIVLDNLSQGRVDLVIGAGYVREEFELFGVPMSERVHRVTEVVRTLKAAFSGEPFEYRGRMVRLTPSPFRRGGPSITLGGSSEGAARRAARIADSFIPSVPEVWDYYRDEVTRLGRADPGPYALGANQVIALADDPEEGWAEIAHYFLHETNAYGIWQAQDGVASPYRTKSDIGEVRAGGQYRVLTPEQLVAELKVSELPFVMFNPMCGGIPPAMAWKSLHLFEHGVLPAFL